MFYPGFFFKAVSFHFQNLVFFDEDCPCYLELPSILQEREWRKRFQTLNVVLVNVFPIVIILAVPHMDFVASLLTIANVKAASILESQTQLLIVIYVIFAST